MPMTIYNKEEDREWVIKGDLCRLKGGCGGWYPEEEYGSWLKWVIEHNKKCRPGEKFLIKGVMKQYMKLCQ